jgi:hypothetical protein
MDNSEINYASNYNNGYEIGEFGDTKTIFVKANSQNIYFKIGILDGIIAKQNDSLKILKGFIKQNNFDPDDLIYAYEHAVLLKNKVCYEFLKQTLTKILPYHLNKEIYNESNIYLLTKLMNK